MEDAVFDKKIVLSDNKVLEDNEKARRDTIQLLSEYKTIEHLQNLFKKLNDPENKTEDIDMLKRSLEGTAFNKGKKLWIEVTVQDSYLSGILFSWLYGESRFDKSRLHALGCSVDSIHFSPVGFTDEERSAIELLYKKTCGK